MGFEPTYEGFAEPDTGDSDPCSPLARFRVRVYRFWAAWRTQTLDRLLGPSNRHNKVVIQHRTAACSEGQG